MAIGKELLKILCCLIFLFPITALPAEKGQEQRPSLPKEHVQKLKRIADFIAGEAIRRGIKTVMVEDITDLKNRPSKEGKAMSQEIEKQLFAYGSKYFSVVKNNAAAVVRGTLVPFKGRNKWQLNMKLIEAETNKIIAVYTGIFMTKSFR